MQFLFQNTQISNRKFFRTFQSSTECRFRTPKEHSHLRSPISIDCHALFDFTPDFIISIRLFHAHTSLPLKLKPLLLDFTFFSRYIRTFIPRNLFIPRVFSFTNKSDFFVTYLLLIYNHTFQKAKLYVENSAHL